MDECGFTLKELQEISAVPVRSIRSWISRGLLHGAAQKGRNARYPESTLWRIKAINDLRKQSLGLDAIADIIQAAGERRLKKYFDGKTELKTLAGAVRLQLPREDSSEEESANLLAMMDKLREVEHIGRGERLRSHPEHWVRVRITDDLELHWKGSDRTEGYYTLLHLAPLVRSLVIESREPP